MLARADACPTCGRSLRPKEVVFTVGSDGAAQRSLIWDRVLAACCVLATARDESDAGGVVRT